MITLGIDAHKRTHTVVAVDERRPRAGHEDDDGNDQRGPPGDPPVGGPVRWERPWAVEDCRHLSRRLGADMLGAGERIVRVPPKLMAHARDSARTYGKSDPIDALAVARAALRHPDLPAAQLDGPARELRLLVDHREDLVAERTRCINRLRWHLHELDPTWDPPARSLTQLQEPRRDRRTGWRLRRDGGSRSRRDRRPRPGPDRSANVRSNARSPARGRPRPNAAHAGRRRRRSPPPRSWPRPPTFAGSRTRTRMPATTAPPHCRCGQETAKGTGCHAPGTVSSTPRSIASRSPRCAATTTPAPTSSVAAANDNTKTEALRAPQAPPLRRRLPSTARRRPTHRPRLASRAAA